MAVIAAHRSAKAAVKAALAMVAGQAGVGVGLGGGLAGGLRQGLAEVGFNDFEKGERVVGLGVVVCLGGWRGGNAL